MANKATAMMDKMVAKDSVTAEQGIFQSSLALSFVSSGASSSATKVNQQVNSSLYYPSQSTINTVLFSCTAHSILHKGFVWISQSTKLADELRYNERNSVGISLRKKHEKDNLLRRGELNN